MLSASKPVEQAGSESKKQDSAAAGCEDERSLKNMLRYTVKRFLSMLLTLFLVATATFFLMHAIPGQPFEVTRETPESVKEAMMAKYGLDILRCMIT